jgi:hypothetical protein
MTNDEILTAEWLQAKLERDQLAQEKARQEEAEEKARENLRENLREAHKQQHGVEPTHAELEHALREKRRQDTVETARVNEAVARRQMHQLF